MKIPVIDRYVEIQKNLKNNMILAPTGNLGIPRSDMPQIDDRYRDRFIHDIRAFGIHVRTVRVPAKSLRMVQGEYNRDKVGSIIEKGLAGGNPIFVSKDGYIIDGNHRLIAHLNTPGAPSYITVCEIGTDVKTLLDKIRSLPYIRYRSLNS